MDRLNDINLAWIPVAALASSVIGAGIGWLIHRARGRRT